MAQQVISKIRNVAKMASKREDMRMNVGSNSLSEHLERVERASAATVRTARSYYETSRKINIAVVIVGIALLANSVGFTWYKGEVDPWNLLSGGLGVASFTVLFFTRPQQNIAKALGNLAQIQMICKSYCLQFDTVLDYHIRNESSTGIDDLDLMGESIRKFTEHAVKLIQDEIEDIPDEESSE